MSSWHELMLPIQAAEDIGRVAAGIFEVRNYLITTHRVLTQPTTQDPQPYELQVLVAAGDSLTMSEQEAAYKNATGRPLPAIPNFFAQLLITTNRHTKGLQVHSSLLVADPCDILFFSSQNIKH